MRHTVNIAGQRFRALLAIEPARDSRGRHAWLCQCDCGKQRVFVAGDLKSGNNGSCGCRIQLGGSWSEYIHLARVRGRGLPHIKKDCWEYRAATRMYNRAKEDGVEFGFASLAECADHLQSIRVTHCPALGIELVYEGKGKGPKWFAASVDKIYPDHGYVRGNIQILSNQANTMKHAATPSQLRSFATWIFKTWT